MHLTLCGSPCILLAEHALLAGEALILADTHFGKSAAFRARGIPIPEGDTVADTARIHALVERHAPRELVIAGDFLHAADGKTEEVLSVLGAFFAALPCPVRLVLGNHDRRAGNLPSDWSADIHDRYDLGDLTVVHDPRHAPPERFTICGHLHPAVRIRDGRNTGFRSPCFWLREAEQQLILPAFGTFTGGQVIRPADADRLFAPLRDGVVELPAAVL
ncbi:MAG: ligase-associated DNA damage response endonuclease PdeM [Akkermansiaceae bacterium]|nr:ligase-associated DNA damage response endonuclease PdeM [Akkermansiaceae bacterium]NNM29524.1 ligase-associated DNA damage response endonuclease PdeM [Akkermansiaceae bacterium]